VQEAAAYQREIAACELCLDWKKALRLLTTMRRLGLKPSVATCNCVLRVCGKAKQTKHALRTLREMWEHGPEPDSGSYTHALQMCDRWGMQEWACYLLAEALRRGLQLRPKHFNLALRSCRWKWASAVWLFGEMQAEGVQPNANSYAAVIAARWKDWNFAIDAFSEMQNNGVESCEVAFGRGADACGYSLRWSHALVLLQQCRRMSQRTAAHPYTSAMTGCAKVRCWEAAKWLLVRSMSQGLRWEFGRTIHSVAIGFKRVGRWDEALHLMKEVVAHSGQFEQKWQRVC